MAIYRMFNSSARLYLDEAIRSKSGLQAACAHMRLSFLHIWLKV